MNLKRVLAILVLVLTLLTAVTCVAFLPGQIAVHWNKLGVADGFLPVWAVLPVSLAVCGLGLFSWELWERRFGDPAGKRIPILNGADRAQRVVVFLIGFAFSCLGLVLNIVFLLKN